MSKFMHAMDVDLGDLGAPGMFFKQHADARSRQRHGRRGGRDRQHRHRRTPTATPFADVDGQELIARDLDEDMDGDDMDNTLTDDSTALTVNLGKASSALTSSRQVLPPVPRLR